MKQCSCYGGWEKNLQETVHFLKVFDISKAISITNILLKS